jgi:hypothetical protein
MTWKLRNLIGISLIFILGTMDVAGQKGLARGFGGPRRGTFKEPDTRSLEFGIMIGGSNYIGELSRQKIYFPETNFAFGIFTRYNKNTRWAFRASFTYGRIDGADENFNDSSYIRNLSFRSEILEFNGLIEYNLKRLTPGKNGRAWAPFVFAGIAVYRFNPKAEYNDEWVELQPLCTEGQGTTKYNEREKYALTQVSIPLGAGLKFQVSPKWTLGLEAGLRVTFTDYLDDVSMTYIEPELLLGAYGPLSPVMADRSPEVNQGEPAFAPGDKRGESNNKDMYIMGGVTISYKLFSKKVNCYSF